jgi:archaemetzincin
VSLSIGVVVLIFASQAWASAWPPTATRTSAEHVPTVCLQPLGPSDGQMLAAARRGIEELLALEVRDLRPRPLPTAAYYPPRKRYRAEKLLGYLEESVRLQSACDYVLGMTTVDIATTKGDVEDWGVFGLGKMPGPVAVVSTFRLRGRYATRRQVAVRVVKVVNHELGHNLGLDHCPSKGCLMEDARGAIKTVDEETGLLCQACRLRLRARGQATGPAASVDWETLLRGIR